MFCLPIGQARPQRPRSIPESEPVAIPEPVSPPMAEQPAESLGAARSDRSL